jgi:hypothetical protein
MSRSTPRRAAFGLCSGLAVALAILVVAPAPAAGVPEPPKGLSAPPQATPMPAFELPAINGSKARAADLRNKVTVIRFWASW